MGLFSKLKATVSHGGVKVHVQAPSSVPGNQVIPVTVTLTSDSSQTINAVKAEIKAQAREQGITMGGAGHGAGIQDSRTTHQTIAVVENREPFTIGPGETKTVNLQLFINGNAASGNPLGQLNNNGGALGNALQAVASVAQNFEHINYIYTVHASANVQGVGLDPSDKQPIQILPPTQETPTAAVPQQPAPPTPGVVSPAPPSPPSQPLPPTPPLPPAPPAGGVPS